MNTILKTLKALDWRYILPILALWVIYAVLTFLAPSTEATGRYGISQTQFNVIRVTFLVPFLFVWMTIAFALSHFRNYAALIGNAQEKPAYNRIANGLTALLLVTVLPSFIRMIVTYNPDDAGLEKTISIIVNYVTIALYLAAFYFFWKASQNLLFTLQVNLSSKNRDNILGWVFILALAYIVAIFNNPTRTFSDDPMVRPTYYLSDPLIILTVALPYVVIWVLGLLAITNFRIYSQHVEGIIYQKSFRFVTIGIAGIIGLLIVLQFLTQLGTFFGHSSLSLILGIIYIILLALAFNYVYLARGAKQLSAIEIT